MNHATRIILLTLLYFLCAPPVQAYSPNSTTSVRMGIFGDSSGCEGIVSQSIEDHILYVEWKGDSFFCPANGLTTYQLQINKFNTYQTQSDPDTTLKVLNSTSFILIFKTDPSSPPEDGQTNTDLMVYKRSTSTESPVPALVQTHTSNETIKCSVYFQSGNDPTHWLWNIGVNTLNLSNAELLRRGIIEQFDGVGSSKSVAIANGINACHDHYQGSTRMDEAPTCILFRSDCNSI